MPGTFTKQFLSAASNGLPIKVTGTATGSSTLLHTSHSSAKDIVWLYAVNTGVGNATLTIEFGGVTSPDHLIKMVIPANAGPTLVVPGVPLSGGAQIKAFATTANIVNVIGHVDRISQTAGSYVSHPVPFDTKAVKFTNTGGERLDGNALPDVSFDNDEPFSIVFWFWMTQDNLSSDEGHIVDNRNITNNARYYVLFDSGSNIYFSLYDGTTHLNTEMLLADIGNDYAQDWSWHQAIFTYGGAGGTAGYLDGVLRVTNSTTMSGSTTMGGTEFRIGEQYSSGSPYEGLLGPVTIYAAELSAADVKAVYNAGTNIDMRTGPEAASIKGYWRMGEGDSGTTIADWSGNGNHLTMENMTVAADVVEVIGARTEGYVYTPHTPGLKSVEFDATSGEYLDNTTFTLPADQLLAYTNWQPITIAWWMRSTGTQTNGADFFHYYNASETDGLYIEMWSTTGFAYRLYASPTLEWDRACYNQRLNNNDGWRLHVFVTNGDPHDDKREYYCNGVRHRVIGSGTDTVYQWTEQRTNIVVGSSGINARMCNLSLWKRYFSQDEVLRLFNNGVPTDVVADFPKGLIHHWPLGDHPDDAYPTLVDVVNGANLTMQGTMSSANIVTDHPANPT